MISLRQTCPLLKPELLVFLIDNDIIDVDIVNNVTDNVNVKPFHVFGREMNLCLGCHDVLHACVVVVVDDVVDLHRCAAAVTSLPACLAASCAASRALLAASCAASWALLAASCAASFAYWMHATKDCQHFQLSETCSTCQ